MRIFTAGAGAGGVDGAIIVFAEKGAGGGIEYVISVGVEVEVCFHQFGGADAEVAGQALDVDVAENGAGGAAAVGALQAVDFLKDFRV